MTTPAVRRAELAVLRAAMAWSAWRNDPTTDVLGGWALRGNVMDACEALQRARVQVRRRTARKAR